MTRHDRADRFAALLLASGLLMLIAPAATLAHSELDKPTPADKSTVTTPVLQVSGTFTESIKQDGSKLLVKDATGATIAQGGVDPGDDKVMSASPPDALASGAYTVEWTTISADDGDVARGTWTFTVAVAATPSPTATPAASASAAPTVAPTPTAAPTSAPSPSPSGSGSDTSGGGSDVILPIVIALIVLGAGAVYLLSRRGRPTPSA
jgi:methionine-rich copper-binding protein CopC